MRLVPIGLGLLGSRQHNAIVDARVLDAVRRWKYQPFSLRGVPIPGCTAVSLTP